MMRIILAHEIITLVVTRTYHTCLKRSQCSLLNDICLIYELSGIKGNMNKISIF